MRCWTGARTRHWLGRTGSLGRGEAFGFSQAGGNPTRMFRPSWASQAALTTYHLAIGALRHASNLPGSMQPLDEAQVMLRAWRSTISRPRLTAPLRRHVAVRIYQPGSGGARGLLSPRTGNGPRRLSYPTRNTRLGRVVCPRGTCLRVTGESPSRLSSTLSIFRVAGARDEPVATYPSGTLGLLSVDVPAGSHRITPIWRHPPAASASGCRWARRRLAGSHHGGIA
jgi:hypothetical protein